MPLQIKFYALLGILLPCALLYSQTPSILHTQSKLKKLDFKIQSLKHNLTFAKDKQGVLNKELVATNREIDKDEQKLHSLQNQFHKNSLSIINLKKAIKQSKELIIAQQELLAQHVRARYQIGEYRPLKWLINQDDPYKISRVMTYYQYIITSRQQLIQNIQDTGKNIIKQKHLLYTELNQAEKLKIQLTQHQGQLQQNKHHQSSLLLTLNQEIQSKQHSLTDFQKDKEQLSQLLKTLTLQTVVQNSKPFMQRRKKLTFPLQNNHPSLQKMNQGITFFAEAGTRVKAVHPGKVVFSDWLNGYGWLLILDHGQGYMTLYAHNQSLLKHKGQMVQQNEQIASVGNSGRIKQNGLYFEIRQRGKAIPPLEWFS